MKSNVYKITKSLGLGKSDVDRIMSNSARDGNTKPVAASVDIYMVPTTAQSASKISKELYKTIRNNLQKYCLA